MNVNMFCRKYMHKILQKHTDFRFLTRTGHSERRILGRALTFLLICSLFWKLSVHKMCQNWPNARRYISIFLALFIVKLIRSARTILAIKQIFDLMYSDALTGHDVTSLWTFWGFVRMWTLSVSNVVCVCYNDHISVHTVVLPNWTVNVFCSVPFWSEIILKKKNLLWPQNPQNDQFWQLDVLIHSLLLVPLCGTGPISSPFVFLQPLLEVPHQLTDVRGL